MTSVTSVTVLGSQMFFWVSLNLPPPRLPFELTVKLRDPSSNLCSTTGHLLFTSVELKRSRAELRSKERRWGEVGEREVSQNGTHWSRNALDAPPNHLYLFYTLLLSNVLAAIISHLYPQYHQYCAVYCILCRTAAFKRETMEKKVSECFLLTPCHSQLVNLTPNQETNGLDWNCWPTIDK